MDQFHHVSNAFLELGKGLVPIAYFILFLFFTYLNVNYNLLKYLTEKVFWSEFSIVYDVAIMFQELWVSVWDVLFHVLLFLSICVYGAGVLLWG